MVLLGPPSRWSPPGHPDRRTGFVMNRSGLAHIQAFLQANRLIRSQAERRHLALAALGAIRRQLPEPLGDHCSDASLSGGTLTLFVDSPAWATRIRFLKDDLARSIASQDIVKVLVQVRATGGTRVGRGPLDPPRRSGSRGAAAGLTAKTAEHLLAAAEEMPDPALADTLRRLARRRAPASKGPVNARPTGASSPAGSGGRTAQEAD